MITLSGAACDVLSTADPHEKARLTHDYTEEWKTGTINVIGGETLPERPARPEKPELRAPAAMPKRRKAGTPENKVALLHAIAHIELNAIDLAWDMIARFAPQAAENGDEDEDEDKKLALPQDFYNDWLGVADDEARHFRLLSDRLGELGAAYGDLPAHDGLWEAAEKTAHDFAARLAIVPMVLEARGLDVTPAMIDMMKAQNDPATATILQTIHDEEIAHVAAGTKWFQYWCNYKGRDIETEWQTLVRTYFHGSLKPPFNHDSREQAGMIRDWYENLV